MKWMYKRGIAIVMSIVLVLGLAAPVKAQTPEYCPLDPVTEMVQVSELLEAASPSSDDQADYLESLEDVIAAVRLGFANRQEEVVVKFVTQNYSEELARDVLTAAYAHTGVPTQGDYLYWQMGACDMRIGGYVSGADYYLTLRYTPEYYTTAQQEAQMDQAVKELLDRLDVYDATDYEKVCAIYDWMTANVVYDYAGLEAQDGYLMYTAYAALINGTSVCQGYANLFYRLALELGVDARIITGIGNGGGHGWNIVKLNGKYYNLDATWDASWVQADLDYAFFLKCQDNFKDHIRDEEYMTEAFHNDYPMGEKDFSQMPQFVLGDMDGDFAVTRNDVICLLLHVTMPGRFPIDAEADFNGDGQVTREDVIRLLLHVTMPNRFPL